MLNKLLLFVQMGVPIMTIGADELCPGECSCSPSAITCEGMTSFPEYIPKTVERVSLFQMDITHIPAGSFDNLINIKHIEIYRSKIQRLASCTFRDLTNMNTTLSINEVEIGEIESYAFSSLANLKSLSLYFTTVDIIHPLAFVDIHKVQSWDFTSLKVNILHSYAISRVSQVTSMNIFTSRFREFRTNAIFDISKIGSFRITQNSFDMLQCRTIEDIPKSVESFSFYNNKLECTCALSWLLPHSKNVDSHLYWKLQDNTCQGPETNLVLDTGKGKAISDLTQNDLKCVKETELKGCPNLVPPSLVDSSCSWLEPQPSTTMSPTVTTHRTSELLSGMTPEASTEMKRKLSTESVEAGGRRKSLITEASVSTSRVTHDDSGMRSTTERRDAIQSDTIHPDILRTQLPSNTPSILLETVTSGYVSTETPRLEYSSRTYDPTSTDGISSSSEREDFAMSSGTGQTSTEITPSAGQKRTTMDPSTPRGRSTPGLTVRVTRVIDLTSAPASGDSSEQSYTAEPRNRPDNQGDDQLPPQDRTPHKVPTETGRGDNPVPNEINKDNVHGSAPMTRSVVSWLVLLAVILVCC